MESFYIGLCIGYCTRIMVLKTLRWPLTSLPVRSLKPIFITGVFFSVFDMMRRASLEELLIKEERAEINKELRQDDKNYDL